MSKPPVIYNRAGLRAQSGIGPWQAIELIAERFMVRLAAVEARKPVPGESGAPGKDGRGIAKAVMDAAGDFILFYSDGTTENLGRVRGNDGRSFESAEFEAMRAELAQMRQAVEDSTSLNKHLAAARSELEASLQSLLARIEAVEAGHPSAWVINEAGELLAVYRDGSQKTLGRVRGHDGAPGIAGEPGAEGAPGKDGRPGVDGLPGTEGVPGPEGTPGKDGIPGDPGLAGPSGMDGAPGKDGAPGADGEDGADGKDGATIEDALVTHGRLEIKMTDRRRIDAGAVRGEPGEPGAPGKDAQLTPELIQAFIAKLAPLRKENREKAQAILDSDKPWEKEGISRATYYRRRRLPQE